MNAGSKACPDCEALVLPDDSFCQECGRQLAAVSHPQVTTASMHALPTCLNCGAKQKQQSKLCFNCHMSMDRVKVYTIGSKEVDKFAADVNVSPVGSISTKTKAKSTASGLAKGSYSEFGRFPEALGLSEYKTGNEPRPYLDLSIIILVFIFFGALVWWLIDYERTNSVFSFKEGLIQAEAAVGANRLNEAVQIMEHISIKGAGKLNVKQRAVLNEALYLRARDFADKRQYRLALSDLLRVTPEFVNYDDVRRLVGLYVAQAQKQMDEEGSLLKNKQLKEIQSKQRSYNLSQNEHDIQANDNRKPNSSSIYSDDDTLTTNRSIEPLQDTLHPSEHNEAQQSLRWNYSDADVVIYHKLLADYFSPARIGTRRKIKDDLGVAAENRDPPTFKEWLDSGKPNF